MKKIIYTITKINCLQKVQLVFALYFLSTIFFANAQSNFKKNRILFLLDASSSMTYKWNESDTRFTAAGRVMLSIIDSMYAQNNEIEFAVRTYGTEYTSQEKNCTDTKIEVPFNMQNINQIKTRLKYIVPLGSSPIAYSLQQASENELSNASDYDYSFVLITDGGESCDGNICETYKKLLANKVKIKPFIIGLDKNNILDNYYSCLGQYVSVATEGDIAKAVKMVVDGNKTLLDKPTNLNLKTTYSNIAPLVKDSVIKIEPKTITIKDGLNFTMPIITKQIIIPTFTKNKIKTLSYTNAKLPVFVPTIVDTPKLEVHYGFATFPIISAKTVAIHAKTPSPILTKWKIKNIALPAYTAEIENVELQNITTNTAKKITQKNIATTLKTRKLIAVTLPTAPPDISTEITKDLQPIFVIPVRNSFTYSTTRFAPTNVYRTFKNVTLPAYNYTEPKTEEKKVSKTKDKKPIVTESIAEYKIKTDQPSNDTRIEIYFTDGGGKYYKTKPMVSLINPKTKKSEQMFMRDILPNGNPEPVKINVDGVFDLVVMGTKDITLKNVKIEKNKVNQITVLVTNGTLIFTYRDDRNKEVPYKAVVNRRFAAGATIVTMCKDERKFEPGNYYVEVNTLPVRRYNTDISFGAITEIQIPDEGIIQVTNTEILDDVEIFFEEGDAFAKCPECKMIVNGNVEEQQLKLLPGLYKISYKKHNAPKMLSPTIVDFQIRSSKTTTLQLK